MKYQETANGVARTYRGTTILFPFGGEPQVLWDNGQTINFVDPERFGSWETPEEQREFVYRFIASAGTDNGLLTFAESIQVFQLLRDIIDQFDLLIEDLPMVSHLEELRDSAVRFLDEHA